MSSLFNHIFIPVVILIIFAERLWLNKTYIIALSFFGILPDIDAIIFVHRASFHNIFILIIPLMIFIFIKDIKICGIMNFYLISHLVLDIFNGGIYLLYPFYSKALFLRIEIWFDNNNIIPILNYGISSKIINYIPIVRGEPMISSENVGITMLLIMVTLSSILINIYGKLKR